MPAERPAVAPTYDGDGPMPFSSSAITVSVPYSNNFESDTSGWSSDNRNDPTCIPIPPLSYCSDIQWNWLSNPELIQVASDIFPAHINLPEEVIDGLSVAYLPEAHSGNKVWWCGNPTNGTYVGDPYDPDLTVPLIEPNPYGNSYCWMEAWLTSPIFNTAGLSEVYMSFWTWWEVECIDIYSFDIMEISISVDGGAWMAIDTLNPPFSRLPGWNANDSYSSGGYLQYGQWVLWTYDLSAYAGHNIQVKFHFYTIDQLYNAFRGWFIDDFYIGGGPEHGELNWNLDAPSALSAVNCRFDPNPFDVDFSVWNSGGTSVHSVTATIILPDGLHLVSGDSIFNLGDIAPAETMNTSWEIFADDTIEGTRCIEILLTSADSIRGYRDNFDEDTARFFVGDPSGNFDYTDAATIAPRATGTPSGSGLAGIPAGGGIYPEADDWTLTSVPFDLTGFTECYISFWHWLDVRESGMDMEGIDGGIVEINVNSTGWQQLDEFATGMLSPRYTGYIRNGISNPLVYKLSYCNDSGGWIFVQSHDLISLGYCSPGDILQVRFRFGTGYFTPDPSNSNGWYIDDFAISSTGHPVGPYNITHCITFPLVDPPRLSISDDSISICAGDTVSLMTTILSGTSPYEFHWTPETGLSSPHSANTYAFPETSTTYICSVVDYFGCSDTDTVFIYVDNVQIYVDGDTAVCYGDTALLTSTVTGGTEPYTFSWYPTDGVISPDSQNTRVIGTSSNWYICTTTDGNGCSSKDSIYLNVHPLPSAFNLISPDDSDSILVGTVNFIWTQSEYADDYTIILNGDTIGYTTDTTFEHLVSECGYTYTWSVIAHNECGDVSSGDFTFYTYSCEGPQVYIIEPTPNAWSACDDQNIILAISDSDGVDDSSIVLTVNGTDYTVDGAILSFDGETLRYSPTIPFTDGEHIDVCLDSACDIHSNCIDSPTCWSFDIDLSPPSVWNEFPSGTIDSIPVYAGFNLDDSLSGLDSSSLSIRIIFNGDTFELSLDSGLIVFGDSFSFDISGLDFSPGDTVYICVNANDSPDYCPPNTLDTCWSFIIAPCSLIANACEDIFICPGTSVQLGASPPAYNGTPPYHYIWTTISGDTIDSIPNPTVSPDTTTTYILTVYDFHICSATDTVTVFSEFEPISAIELLYPPADTSIPPGPLTLYWHSLGGTSPIYYNVILDDSIIASGINDTFFTYDFGCDETHFWSIIAYNICSQSIPHCDSIDITYIEDTTLIYYCDSVIIPSGYPSDTIPFHTFPCEGPIAHILRPTPNSYTSCNPETILIQIDGDSIVDSSIVIRVNGIEYTTDSVELDWSEPYLTFLPSTAFSDSDTVNVCLLSANDIYGNPLTGDSLCWQFYTDYSSPNIIGAYPPSDTILFTSHTQIYFELDDWLSSPDTNSIQIYINDIILSDSCIEIADAHCGGHCFIISIDTACFEFSGCDTAYIRVLATDTTDYCDDNILDTLWSFSFDCEGPYAEAIYIPPFSYSSCEDDSIIIYLWDSLPGVDTSSISIYISPIGTFYWGDPELTYRNDSLIVRPSSPLPDEGAISVELLSANDLLGNPLHDTLLWTFYTDKIPPIAYNWYPLCGDSISDISPEISIEPYDSGCGIFLDSTELSINDTLIFTFSDGEISYIGGRLVFDPDDFGIRFSGGDSIVICWHLVDCADDICSPNFLDTCCVFYISSGGPICDIRYPSDSIWDACNPDSIRIFLQDEDGIITSSISFDICFGGACTDCDTFTTSSAEVRWLTEWDDSLEFWFVPGISFSNGDTICIHILTATDSLGNSLSDGVADSIIFYTDFAPPNIWGEYPTGELTTIPNIAGFHLADSLSGLDTSSVSVFIILDSDTINMTYSNISDSFYISLDSIEFTPSDTITICVSAGDSPDICGPNILDTCWSFITPPCGLIVNACEDAYICPGDEIMLGAIPPASGGIEPYYYLWITSNNDTVDTIANPVVSPDTTTTYILFVRDSYGCTDSDTITVFADFHQVSSGEYIYPPADTTLPPGPITLIWHNIDGTLPIYYNLYLDDTIIRENILDTFVVIDIPCGETHNWSVELYNIYYDTIPHCEGDSIWYQTDSCIYIIDSMSNPWGWSGNPIFHTYPCTGPVASFEHPFDSAFSSCQNDTITLSIYDSDGVVDSSITITINGITYTVESSEIQWSEPTLTYISSTEFADGQTVSVCIDSANDIYGNPLNSPQCWEYYIDKAPPRIDIIEPDTTVNVRNYEQNITFDISDRGSGIDISSITYYINGVNQTENLVLTGDSENLRCNFNTRDILGQFVPGETVFVSIDVCDSPDFCAPNCSQLDFTFITVPEAACYVHPNPFTPDGNNINDFTVFDYPSMFAKEATIKIFNLRGIEVFSKNIGPIDDYSEQGRRQWDGTDGNGKKLPDGIYMYIIIVDGEVVCNGTVVLAR